MAAAAGDEPETTVEVKLRAVGPSRPTTIRLPPLISVADLRRSVALDRRLPEDRLRLVLRGTTLPWGDDTHVKLRDGDSLIVAVAPKPPAKHLRGDDDDDDDDDEEELLLVHPVEVQDTSNNNLVEEKDFHISSRKTEIARANDQCGVNSTSADILLMALFSVTMKAWIIITLWFLLAPIARKYEVGPLYLLLAVSEHFMVLSFQLIDRYYCLLSAQILATGFLIILLNLGRRQQGDISAYSIFNEDFREIPGTFNAERIDRDLRAGQLHLSAQIQKSRVMHRYAGFVADETSTLNSKVAWKVASATALAVFAYIFSAATPDCHLLCDEQHHNINRNYIHVLMCVRSTVPGTNYLMYN
ncbi:hypothetical protein TRIUR3_22838 [Triticum urartu]|uniref:Uncharacterized protein n=1 Tax=Triticum urartu TaxID=4572 RepID=M8ASK7_TRIUA|nr:hypothetical protein TRIUR3_22838 [Triticum urartu]